MNKTALLFLTCLISFNSMAELGKLKITKDNNNQDKEEDSLFNTNSDYLDQDGNKLLTLEQVYEKYGDSDEGLNYIKINEMFDQVEERNKKMR